MLTSSHRRWLLLSPALLLLLFGASGPLIMVLLYSFLEAGNYGGIQWEFSLKGWREVLIEQDIFDGTYSLSDVHLKVLWRSIKLSLITTAATFLIGFPTAYFIATRPKKSRNIWLLFMMVPFWTNLLVRTFAIMELFRNTGTVNSVLLSLGLIETPIAMLYTEFAVTYGMAYVYLPLMVLPIYASLERLDFTLVEAAYDLYATRLRVMWRVILPLAKPGVIAGSVLVFVPSLGAYVIPRVLGGGRQMMLGNLIDLEFGQLRNWPLGSAMALTLLLLVSIALFIYIRSAGKRTGGDHGI